jgi:hypothetical protein
MFKFSHRNEVMLDLSRESFASYLWSYPARGISLCSSVRGYPVHIKVKLVEGLFVVVGV